MAGLVALAAPAGAAEFEALLGRRLTDVRLLADAAPVTEPAVLMLVETRVGEPLVMADVRQTIDHLVTLGRFADIRVFGEADGDGVRLRYDLVPIERVVRVRFDGPRPLDDDALRADLDERFGTMPPVSRRDELAQAIADRYRARGFAGARVDLRLTPAGRPGEVVAVVAVTPGPRTVIGRVDVEGDGPADLLTRLDLAPGQPFDRETFDQRVRAVEDALRDDRYYEAVVSATVREAGPSVADISVRATLGDPVRVDFVGDPLPASRRRTLVPIRAGPLGGRGGHRGREPQHRAVPAARGLPAGRGPGGAPP